MLSLTPYRKRTVQHGAVRGNRPLRTVPVTLVTDLYLAGWVQLEGGWGTDLGRVVDVTDAATRGRQPDGEIGDYQ